MIKFALACFGVWLFCESAPLVAQNPFQTLSLTPILGDNLAGNALGLAYNPSLDVFYLAYFQGAGVNGFIDTLDNGGRLLNSLDFVQKFGMYPTSLSYDASTKHLFVLAGSPTATDLIEMSPDAATVYTRFQVYPASGSTCTADGLTNLDGAIWISCFADRSIRQYSRVGAVVTEVSIAGLFPPNGPINYGPTALAPDFSGGLLVDDQFGQRLLDIHVNGTLLAAATTQSFGIGQVLAIASDTSLKRIFFQVNNRDLDFFTSGLILTPLVHFSNSTWTFSAHAVGTTSGIGQIFITNTGPASFDLQSALVSSGESSGAAAFNLINNCPRPLGLNQTCNLQLTFTPIKTGLNSASIQLSDNAYNVPQLIPIQGVGLGPVLKLSNLGWGFKNHSPGQSSPPSTMYVTNTGTAVLHFSSITMTGAAPADFPIVGTTCGPALPQKATCSVTFKFAPTALGTRTAILTFVDDAVPAKQTMILGGQGTAH